MKQEPAPQVIDGASRVMVSRDCILRTMRNSTPLKVFAAFALAAAAASSPRAQRAPQPSRSTPFQLTVDSIMRGPKLVGYTPSGLRWSGDSERLYFEWRKPGEEEPSTYVVSRAGGTPTKLNDAERKLAPPASGRWDRARRRAVFIDAGDIVLVDSIAGTRREITRTTATEGNPRWARNDT